MDIRRWLQLPLQERVALTNEAREGGGSLLTAIESYNSSIEEPTQPTQPPLEMEPEQPAQEPVQEQFVPSGPLNYSIRELKTMNPTRSNFDPLALQEDLIGMGYNLEPTGEWDDVTKEALWDWQDKHTQEYLYGN